MARDPWTRARGSAGRHVALVAAGLAAASLSCAGTRPRPALALENASGPIIAQPGEAALVLRNQTRRALVIPFPGDAFFLVGASSGEGTVYRCRTAPPPPERLDFVTVEPGDAVPLDVDLPARCEVPPGQDHRFVVHFAVPEEVSSRPGGRRAWIGATAPLHIQVRPGAAGSGGPRSAW